MAGVEYRPGITSIFGRISWEKGKMAEDRVNDVLQRFVGQEVCPDWFCGYEVASIVDDRRGIDGWVLTDIGKIPIQIKSSRKGAEIALAKKPQIPVFVVSHYSARDEEIFSQCMAIIGQEREKYLGEREDFKE